THQYRINELESLGKKLDEEKQKIEDNIERYNPSTSWVSIGLLLAAAIAFIVGEITVNIKIVADAFNMEGPQGLLFAVGLSAVSVLLKPAYDRLLEKKYLDGRPKIARSFIIVISAISILAVVTAYFLGEFRFDTEALNKITELDEEKRKKLGQTLEKAENELYMESMTGHVPKWSFILAAILFAIGGTVCLSVALTAAEYQFGRRKWRKRLDEILKKIESQSREKDDNVKASHQAQANVKTLERQIAQLPKADAQRAELEKLRQELTTKTWETAEYEWKAVTALYRNAHERGKVVKEYYRENPEVWRKFFDPPFQSRSDGESADLYGFMDAEIVETSDGQSMKYKRRTPVRPYQALKLAIGAYFRNRCRELGYFDPSVKNYDVEI
ncbi:MAG: hypothetical protein RMM53_04510, partial [Bacteroidia bacterium]|nr:hypothetical protein [Bacteroidia bacterium]MDW8333459.1 hypothetical protein [Bacteroidia bacterium]